MCNVDTIHILKKITMDSDLNDKKKQKNIYIRDFYSPSRKLLRIKVPPDLHLTYSKKWGKRGVGIENDKIQLVPQF